MKRDKDWIEVMRSELRSAEPTPPADGWERLRRALAEAETAGGTEAASTSAAAGNSAPEPAGKPAAAHVGGFDPAGGASGNAPAEPAVRGAVVRLWPRIAAAAAAVILCVAAGELLWRADIGSERDGSAVALSDGRDAADETLSPMQRTLSGSASGRLPEKGMEPVAESALAQAVAPAVPAAAAPRRETGVRKAVLSAAPTGPERVSGQVPGNTSGIVSAPDSPTGASSGTASAPHRSTGTASETASASQGSTGLVSAAAFAPKGRNETVSASAPDNEPAAASESNSDKAGPAPAPETRSTTQPRNTAQPRKVSEPARRTARSEDRFVAYTPSRKKTSFGLFAGGVVTGGGAAGPAAGWRTMQSDFSSVIGNGDNLSLMQRADYGDASFRHHQPVSFGLSVRREFAHGLSLESGVIYTLLRSDVRMRFAVKDVGQRLHFVGVPLRANWQYFHRAGFSLYIGAGGMVEKCVSAKFGSKVVHENGVEWSVLGAAGAEYRFGGLVGLYFEPEISYYFTRTSLETARTDSPLTLTLRLGVRFSF